MAKANQWWGYMHTNGKVQAKRFWGDMLDLKEARESPFVVTVIQPFDCDNREEALRQVALRVESLNERES